MRAAGGFAREHPADLAEAEKMLREICGDGEAFVKNTTSCPKCGKEMDLFEKDTSSGRDMRTYVCRPCNEYVDVDNGVALWQVLHDANEKMEEGQGLEGCRAGNGVWSILRARAP